MAISILKRMKYYFFWLIPFVIKYIFENTFKEYLYETIFQYESFHTVFTFLNLTKEYLQSFKKY
jgi:hypothetical protein